MPQAKDLSDLLREQLGVNTRPVISESTIGTSNSKVLSNDPNRVALTFINLSANTIYLMIDNLVSTTRGIRLDSGGGSVSFTWQYDMHLLLYEWHAVASDASSQLLVIEEKTI